MYKVRFHLKTGKYFKHWQVTELNTKSISYYDPDKFNLTLLNVKLINKPSVANKIYTGANKTVCAWCLCESVVVTKVNHLKPLESYLEGLNEVMYNPRVAPNWVDNSGGNIDGCVYGELVSFGNRLFRTK